VNRFRLDDLHAYIYRTHDGGKTWKKITEGIPDEAAVNAVREDPKRAGLLFASTEREMWVSLDDGDHWHSLQMNLPYTSMRDFVIHGDDIVVGTHGRSFWILDDITPLRQIHEGDAGESRLFQPQVATRIQRSTNPDTPLPPETPMGQNPPDGAVLDYVLKASAKLVTMEILDAAGKVVRRFASDDKPEPFDAKEINVPTYWVRQERVLSAAAGMHRWVWDVRYPKPKSFESDYPISAIPHDTPAGPLGPVVVPGEYTVRLTVDGVSTTRRLKVRLDPRVPATAADLQAMLAAEQRAAADLSASYAALQQVRALRTQLKAIKDSGPEAVRGVGAQVEDQLGKLESGASGKTPAPGVSAARGMATVHSWLNQAYGTLDSSDAAPTLQALAMLKELEKVSAQQLNEIKRIQAGPLAELNQRLRQAGAKEVSQSYDVEPEAAQGAERSEE
jgi:Sortilin, neurotensin receptor 3,